MKTGWLRAVALVSSLSIATVLVARASGGCGGEQAPASATIKPEATGTAAAAPTGAPTGVATTEGQGSTATGEPSQALEEDVEFFGTGKSGPVRRKPRSSASSQPSPANQAQ